jgi:hypothetical protein
VEYTLLVAVLAVPTVGALDLLRDTTKAKTEQTAADMSDPTIPIRPTSTVPTGPTTTTTQPTTTHDPAADDHHDRPAADHHDRPPTTTTAPATRSVSTWGPVSTRTASNPTRWAAATSVTVRDEYGQAVNGATVVIRIQYRTSGGNWATVSPDASGTTNASGTLLIDSGLFRSSGTTQPRADEIRFQVRSVTKAGLEWESNTNRVSAAKPN